MYHYFIRSISSCQELFFLHPCASRRTWRRSILYCQSFGRLFLRQITAKCEQARRQASDRSCSVIDLRSLLHTGRKRSKQMQCGNNSTFKCFKLISVNQINLKEAWHMWTKWQEWCLSILWGTVSGPSLQTGDWQNSMYQVKIHFLEACFWSNTWGSSGGVRQGTGGSWSRVQ